MTITEDAPPPTRRRRGVLLWWVLVLPGLLWAVVRLGGWERSALVQLFAFTPYVAAWSVPLALAALLRRRWLPGALAVVAAVGLVGAVLPRALPDDRPAARGPQLRVMTSNMFVGSADPAQLVDLVRRYRVDVLALQEYTSDGEAALVAAGLAAELPHRQSNAEVVTTGSGLWSRHPLSDTGMRRNGGGFAQSYGTVAVPGGPPVLVESAHPRAPATRQRLDVWRADLAAQPPATAGGPLRILLGDFNATLDHAAMRRVLGTGYTDAADALGTGLIATWGPYDGTPIPPVTSGPATTARSSPRSPCPDGESAEPAWGQKRVQAQPIPAGPELGPGW
ncbi:endonuclease/exonuclease/phosphatase family protein [Spirilliplanes yamanashiensis]|nr:endonuclease/exonuclease/phosphatase family protein [Spirilliplanes yamanashiensis]MDP9816277.1 endonuclease/exonuclease/phosphatase (EEP) superfamily protein YafD [Spirilliplanes yamanashiensis]